MTYVVQNRRIHNFSELDCTIIKIDYFDRKEAVNWCKENFGEPDHRSSQTFRWNYGIDEFWFLDDADAMLFALRWK
jgi:hypothetical protein